MAALLAAGVLALAPDAAQAFICESVAGGGAFATDAGDVNNVACGTNADASGVGSANFAMGTDADAGGDNSLNVAIGTNPAANGDNSFNTAIGTAAEANGNNSENFAMGRAANAIGNDSFNTAMGRSANAAGNSGRNLAVGFSANAAGSNSNNVAIGTSSVSTGGDSTAIGPTANATFANSAAFGNGATATRVNQQIFGTATNTYTLPGVTSAASTAAQGAVSGLITTDAAGNLASDGGATTTSITTNTTNITNNATSITNNTNNISTNTTNIAASTASNARQDRRIDKNQEGTAVAIALADPDLFGGQTFALKGNWGTFEGSHALGFSLKGLVTDNLLNSGLRLTVSGGMGFGLAKRTKGGRVSAQIGW